MSKHKNGFSADPELLKGLFPEQKPTCFNYATTREMIIALAEENQRLSTRQVLRFRRKRHPVPVAADRPELVA